MKRIMTMVMILFTLSSFAQDVKTYIPKQAPQYLPMLKEKQNKHWKDHPLPHALASLIEHESCISVTHSRCWNPKSQLLTKRERGSGFGQITKAFREDGSVRFDALQELKEKHSALSEWSWDNVLIRPDLQLLGIVLKSKDDFNSLFMVKDPVVRLHFTDMAYNSGMGNVNKKRRECGLRKNCDPQLYFGNVEHVCPLNAKPIYGNRTACMITNSHVKDVYQIRLNKYKPYF
jgi:hypothetical protein